MASWCRNRASVFTRKWSVATSGPGSRPLHHPASLLDWILAFENIRAEVGRGWGPGNPQRFHKPDTLTLTALGTQGRAEPVSLSVGWVTQTLLFLSFWASWASFYPLENGNIWLILVGSLCRKVLRVRRGVSCPCRGQNTGRLLGH